MTILLIDDHDLVLKGLLSVLRSAFPKTGFITARSGEEALDAVRGTHVDLAVLDPRASGSSNFCAARRPAYA